MKISKKMWISLAVSVLASLGILLMFFAIQFFSNVFEGDGAEMLSLLCFFVTPVLFLLLGAVIDRYLGSLLIPFVASAVVTAGFLTVTELITDLSNANSISLEDYSVFLLAGVVAGLCSLVGGGVSRILKKIFFLRSSSSDEGAEDKAPFAKEPDGSVAEENKAEKKLSPYAIYAIFIFVTLALGILLMLFNLDSYFDTSGSILPMFTGVIAMLPLISAVLLLAAFIIKSFVRERVSFTALALIAILVPVGQYVINFYFFDTLEDFAKPKYSYEENQGEGIYGERVVESETKLSSDDISPFCKIVTVTRGSGEMLSESRVKTIDPEEKVLKYSIPSKCEIKSVDIYISFDIPSDAEKYSFSVKSRSATRELSGELLEDGRLRLSLPSDYIDEIMPPDTSPNGEIRRIEWKLK